MAYVSVLERAQKKLETKKGGKSLVRRVNQMHKLLSNVGNGSDEETARKAEIYLSWLVFGEQTTDNDLDQLYRMELINSNPQIKIIVNIFNQFAKKSLFYNIKQIEAKKNKVSEDIIKDLLVDVGQFSSVRGNVAEVLLKRLGNIADPNAHFEVTGGISGTVAINAWTKDFLEELDQYKEKKIKKLIEDGEYFRWQGKDIKQDISGSSANFESAYFLNADIDKKYVSSCLKV